MKHIHLELAALECAKELEGICSPPELVAECIVRCFSKYNAWCPNCGMIFNLEHEPQPPPKPTEAA